MYFLSRGECGFSLPGFKNTVYIHVSKGNLFGLIDILGSSQKNEFEINSWHLNKNLLERQFSVQAQTEAELLAFQYQDLHRMSQEFSECYDLLFEEAVHMFRRVLLAKLLAIKHCRNMSKNKNVGILEEDESIKKGSTRRLSA